MACSHACARSGAADVEHIILFAGPMGAGKTTAIQSLSDTPVIATEAANSDRETADKATTTVALDYGEIIVSDEEKIRLYGIPGCLLYTSPSPRDGLLSRMPSSA